jgi:hypothetical protein
VLRTIDDAVEYMTELPKERELIGSTRLSWSSPASRSRASPGRSRSPCSRMASSTCAEPDKGSAGLYSPLPPLVYAHGERTGWGLS